MGFDRMLPKYPYHKIPDKCEWENGLQPDNKGGIVWYSDGSKTNTGTDTGAQEGGKALVLGSTPEYFKLKYMPSRFV